MNRPILPTLRHSGILLTLMIVTALTLGLAAPANAARPSDRITAQFDPSTGVLAIRGDQHSNTITVGRNAAGAILINGGEVQITGGISTVANTSLIEVSGLGGNDTLRLDEANGALPAANLLGGNGNDALTGGSGGDSLQGQAGDDTLLGQGGTDQLLGGDGNDSVDGQQGNDAVSLGAGNDTFQWDPGDGNDLVEGQDGSDAMLFNGANVAETFDIAANGGRVRFFRNVGSVTIDLDDVELIDLRALGGADNVVVGDLSGTDPTLVSIDLRGPNGAGDGSADTVTVNGTEGDDAFGASGGAGGISVSGLHTPVSISNQEQANDRLTLNGLGGVDNVNATSLQADGIQLTIDGGPDADVLLGSQGGDVVSGGDGDDTAFLGAGDDTFIWNPGDNNDTIEGQAGFDRLLFNGANVAETFDIAANGGRVRFFRNIANITMDLDDVEGIQVNALGGSDITVVNDMSGTDLIVVNANLAAVGGGGDAAADSVIVNGTTGDDVIAAAGDASGTAVSGLAAQVSITGAEAANDRLTINALAGDDVVDATGLAASAIQLTADGGAGDDVLLGGAGNDVLLGGEGDDVLIGGPGIDTLDGGPGNNIIIQD